MIRLVLVAVFDVHIKFADEIFNDQKGNFQHFYLGHISGRTGNPHVGQDGIKVASVIADIEHRLIFWNVLFTDGSDRDA